LESAAPSLLASGQAYVDVRIRGIERDPAEAWSPIDITAGDELPVQVRNQVAVPVEILNELVPVDVKNVVVKTSLVPLEKK
jgi:LEA14-like dessication related protein